jgi:hypothetical protein
VILLARFMFPRSAARVMGGTAVYPGGMTSRMLTGSYRTARLELSDGGVAVLGRGPFRPLIRWEVRYGDIGQATAVRRPGISGVVLRAPRGAMAFWTPQWAEILRLLELRAVPGSRIVTRSGGSTCIKPPRRSPGVTRLQETRCKYPPLRAAWGSRSSGQVPVQTGVFCARGGTVDVASRPGRAGQFLAHGGGQHFRVAGATVRHFSGPPVSGAKSKDGRAVAYPDVITVPSHTKRTTQRAALKHIHTGSDVSRPLHAHRERRETAGGSARDLMAQRGPRQCGRTLRRVRR